MKFKIWNWRCWNRIRIRIRIDVRVRVIEDCIELMLELEVGGVKLGQSELFFFLFGIRK